MPRFVRVENTMVHIPSLSSVSIHSNCFGRPYLMLYYHTKVNLKIQYSSWDKCESDFNRLKTALVEVETLLQQIPLTVEKPVVSTPTPATVAPAPAVETRPQAAASQIEVIEQVVPSSNF